MNEEEMELDFDSLEDEDFFGSNSTNKDTDKEIETIEELTNTNKKVEETMLEKDIAKEFYSMNSQTEKDIGAMEVKEIRDNETVKVGNEDE